ncbi:MAG TPA: D-TA family PLP-dependent enzyme [Mesorhizobium sp.]|jgi:D-serine deaminase-like pyridoxal phosphate-dependent protein|nr:D-TA family PLP-dependent enzyme [Mesorhizobium sp.]
MRPGASIDDLTTPVPLIDEDVVDGNIARVQSFMDRIGLRFRPHIKTHKIPDLARRQIAAGAMGINAQKISEAQVFADAGIDDILITYNILGTEKLAALRALHERVTLSVVADSLVTVEGLASTFAPERPLSVLVECDTGGKRCGVQSPHEALRIAQAIAAAPGLRFAGLLAYPRPWGEEEGERFLSQAVALLAENGLPCETVSYAGSPSLFSADKVPSATEYRAGTYIYNDRSMIRAGHCTEAECAMTVLTSVVSRPTPDRAVIDAGSKTLTSDLLGFSDHGLILGLPEARIVALSEEHAVVDLSGCGDERPQIGEKLRVVPNHACVVSNLFDEVIFHRNGMVTGAVPVAARGKVW